MKAIAVRAGVGSNTSQKQESEISQSYLDMDPVTPRFRTNRHSLSRLLSGKSNKGAAQLTRLEGEEGAQSRHARLSRQRLSGIFTVSTILEAKKGTRHDSSLRSVSTGNDPPQRQDVFCEPFEAGEDLYLMNGPEGMIEIVSSDKQHILYKTSLPASFKLKGHAKLSHVTISSVAVPRSLAIISRPAGHLSLEIQGLQAIKFYRARPDCLMPVECFTLTPAIDFRRSYIRNDDSKVVISSNDINPTFSYAWKNTAMVGRGGLKLVDLRDSEVLAYYEPSLGKYIAKIHLQGSGIKLIKIVIATILALKARALLKDEDAQNQSAEVQMRGRRLTTCIEEAPEDAVQKR